MIEHLLLPDDHLGQFLADLGVGLAKPGHNGRVFGRQDCRCPAGWLHIRLGHRLHWLWEARVMRLGCRWSFVGCVIDDSSRESESGRWFGFRLGYLRTAESELGFSPKYRRQVNRGGGSRAVCPCLICGGGPARGRPPSSASK